MPTMPRYVIVTPARDEAQFIELTIKSVVAQKSRPIKWIIVSDGSTDGTDEIARRYVAAHGWMEVLRVPERRERHFAGKVLAFNAGLARVQALPYDVIVCMDGDISFGPDYFSFLLGKLAEDPKLGLVGTPFTEGSNGPYDYRFTSIDHVSGQCQVWRRECFEEIGGYIPVKGGGIDLIAVTTARMRGWKTKTFLEQAFVHHRVMGTAVHSALGARFRQGVKDYVCGNDPAWELFRVAYQMARPPIIVGGGLVLGAGYLWAAVQRLERPIPREMVVFRRREQMKRLKNILLKPGMRPTASDGLEATVGGGSGHSLP